MPVSIAEFAQRSFRELHRANNAIKSPDMTGLSVSLPRGNTLQVGFYTDTTSIPMDETQRKSASVQAQTLYTILTKAAEQSQVAGISIAPPREESDEFGKRMAITLTFSPEMGHEAVSAFIHHVRRHYSLHNNYGGMDMNESAKGLMQGGTNIDHLYHLRKDTADFRAGLTTHFFHPYAAGVQQAFAGVEKAVAGLEKAVTAYHEVLGEQRFTFEIKARTAAHGFTGVEDMADFRAQQRERQK